MATIPPNQPHALYRFYSRDGELLYVGITLNAPSRFTRHAHSKAWWLEVGRIEMEPFDTRQDVLDAEKAAIKAERPRYNKVHNRQALALAALRGVDDSPRALAALEKEQARLARPRSPWLDTVAAFGLEGGECVVGLVREVDGDVLDIDLYSFLSGYFAAGSKLVRLSDVRQFRIAALMDEHTARRAGYNVFEGESLWDMDPLAEFQTAWKRQAA